MSSTSPLAMTIGVGHSKKIPFGLSRQQRL
jgi:hypothetical protein